MKTGVTITVRLKSERLEKKVLLNLNGKPMIERLIERIKFSKLPQKIILCTSINADDNELIQLAKKTKIDYFRGSEDDVLLRLLEASKKFKIDFIVSTTGDNPLTDPFYIDKTIEKYEITDADFIYSWDLPLGTFSYGVKVNALKEVVRMKNESDTEIWGHYFMESELFHVKKLDIPKNLQRPDLRLTVDEKKDYILMREIFKNLYLHNKYFTLEEVINFLDNNPKLKKTNQNIKQKAFKV